MNDFKKENPLGLFKAYFTQRNKSFFRLSTGHTYFRVLYKKNIREDKNKVSHLKISFLSPRGSIIKIIHYPNTEYLPYMFQHDLQYLFPSIEYSECVYIDLKDMTDIQGDKLNFSVCKEKLDKVVPKRQYGKKPYKLILLDSETCYVPKGPEEDHFEKLKNNTDTSIYTKLSKELYSLPYTIQVKEFGSPEAVQVHYGEKDKFKALFDGFGEIEKNYSVVVIAHNASFDCSILKRVYELYDSRVFFKTTTGSGKALIRGETMGRHKHIYYCSYFLTREDLATASGLKKPTFPYGLLNPSTDFNNRTVTYKLLEDPTVRVSPLEDLELYARFDVEALEVIMKGIQDRIRDFETTGDLPSTDQSWFDLLGRSNASLGQLYVLMYIGRYFEDIQKIVPEAQSPKDVGNILFKYPIDEEEYGRRLNGVHGGFTFYNKDKDYGEAPEGHCIYSIDITSAYPYEMKKVPCREFLSTPPKEGDYTTGILCRATKGVYTDTKRPKRIPPSVLPEYQYLVNKSYLKEEVLKDQGTEFYLLKEYFEVVKTLFGEEELSKYIEVVGKKYQSMSTILGECVEKYLYNKKEALDIELKNPNLTPLERAEKQVSRKAVKIYLNALYGKLIQKTYEVGEYFVNGRSYSENNQSIKGKNVSTGSYIAQKVRTRILTQLLIFHAHPELTPLFGDTDGMSFIGPKGLDLSSVLDYYIPGGALGSGSLKGIFNRVYHAHKQKKYVLINTETGDIALALSGVSGLVELVTNLGKKNREKFYFFMDILMKNKEGVGFVGGKTISKKGAEEGDIVIGSQTVGLSSRTSTREGKYKILIKISQDRESFDIINID